ncbi:MAG: hypothetical protein RIC55_25305 [Pirellulaceae bacterium]
MENTVRQAKQHELEQLRQRIAQLESELAHEEAPRWQARQYYAAYFATTGFMLGLFGGATSLLFNVVGALMLGEKPLRLIQVYLTFGWGEQVLAPGADTNMLLALGCCLYLGTGMLLGVPFHLIMTLIFGGSLEPPKFLPDPFQLYFANSQGFANLLARLGVATVLGLSMWLVHFYLILSWLQPALFHGDWIVTMIPAWVAALTHLVFAWTMALVYPLGAYTPYEPAAESETE